LNIQSGLWDQGKSSAIWKAIGRRMDRKILQFNYKFISRFTECWVPDLEGADSLAGLLSRMPDFPSAIPIRYIGWLSRFKAATESTKKNSLLILLSGPEPQRTELEQILVPQLARTTLNAVMVRGLPGEQVPALTIAGVEVFNHLDSSRLAARISTAEFIMARSGYSTIMDLVQLQKNAILIATPGQTEQEYLSKYLNEKKWMHMVAQQKLNLENSLEDFKKTKLLQLPVYASLLGAVIEELLKNCIERKIQS
jgi:UDP-N-acetylglucosamine transferase subunit ALG13